MKYIKINKAIKRLRLVEKKRVVFDFPCVTGKMAGRKLSGDDLKTPEGEYLIVVKNPKSKYFLSLGLNYPNIQDAADGFRLGIIDRVTRDQIIQAQKDYLKNPKTIIPWDTALAGRIYIHGEGDNTKDYTEGCIKLSNLDIQQLYGAVEVGMKVIIF